MRQGPSEKHEMIDRKDFLSHPRKFYPQQQRRHATTWALTVDVTEPGFKPSSPALSVLPCLLTQVPPVCGWEVELGGIPPPCSCRKQSRGRHSRVKRDAKAHQTPGSQAELAVKGEGTEMEFRESPSEVWAGSERRVPGSPLDLCSK